MGNPPLSTLVDNFTAATLNAVWNKLPTGWALDTVHDYVTVPVPTTSGSVNAFGTNNLYDATGTSIYARVGVAQYGAGHVGTRMRIRLDSNNAVTMRVDSGSFQMNVITGGTTTTTTLPTYDPTAHAWWRLRESSGVFYADASPDGYAWTNLASMSYSWSVTAITFQFETAALATENSGNLAWFTQVNTTATAAGLMPSWPQIRFQVAFNSNGTLSTQPAYTDLTSRLRGSWSAQQSGRQYELDQIQSGQLSVTLQNEDGALDPTDTGSPYWPNIVPLKPCRLQAVWPPPNRNLFDQLVANGTAPAASWYAWRGTLANATGISAPPTGHTTALAWTFPATSSSANGYPLLVGNTAGSADPSSIPVTAGQQYTLSGWINRSSGGDTTVTMSAIIIWYGASGSQINTSTTTVTVPVTPSWVEMVLTGTAPAGAQWARVTWWLGNTSTTATNTFYLTALQFEQGSSATPWTAPGRIYNLWGGFVERWPQQWDYSGTYGLVDLTAVDALAGLAQFTLQPSLEANLLALGPDRLYPLDEPSGATGFRDATGKHGLGNILHSSYGSGTITFGNSVQGTGFTGAAGPVCTITNPAPSSSTSSSGSFLNLAAPNGPPVSSTSGWTRIICFRTTTLPTSGAMAIWYWQNSASSNQSQGGIYIDTSGHVNCASANASGQTLASFAPGVNVCDGAWHMFAMLLSADGKTMNLNLDGAGYVATSSFNAQPSGINCDVIGMNATFATNTYTWAYSGDVAYAVEIPTTNIPSFSDLAAGFSTGWAGETSVKRAQRILTMAGSGLTLTSEGTGILMGGANLAGTDAMSALSVVGDTEAGQVWADGAGAVRLDGRVWRYVQNTPAVVFGEQQAANGIGGGEVPYLGDVAVDFDDTHIYNAIQVTNQVAPGATEQPAAAANNTTSQAAYLPRSLQRTINANDATLPQSQANYLASAYGSPYARVSRLTVDCAANPTLWSQVLPLSFGTRATVNRRPPSGPGAAAQSLPQFIEQMTWNGDDQGNLKLALELTPAQPFTGWGVVASLHSTLQSQATSGSSAITLGALTGSASNTAATVLPVGTQLVVGYGTTVAETVTVLSVGATSPGYTSVTVTLTANLASTHAAGSVVCQPLPSGYTLPSQVASGFPSSLDTGATLSSTGPLVAY